ncbi:MAG: M14 family zinc carboxypeptidase [Candidatus Kapabacteria bacterium]|nr:M14 family zinc carboxypeptidase [Candidatus Kapabacteria bacterium]
MKKLIIIFLVFFSMSSYSREKFSKVQIKLDSIYTVSKINEMGIDLEGAIIKEGLYINTVVNQYELSNLNKLNLIEFVEIEDLENYYLENASKYKINDSKSNQLSDLNNFKLGSLGGYYTLDEIYENFDKMILAFPNIVSKEVIGKSYLNKDLYAYKFHLENAEFIKPDEILYTSLHHAREPQGVTTIIFFLWHLLENFKSNNPESIYLLKSKLIFAIPVINPDSYKLNQQTPTVGGGLIRKNQRLNSDSSKGVDLNRNYGPFEFWDSPAGGSETSQNSETYRGTAPFSEPETNSIQQFALRHNFKTALNYHSYGNLFIHPGSAVEGFVKDSILMQQIGFYINESNKYVYGPDIRAVGYFARGSSDDWFYTDKIKGKQATISFTPELGHAKYGFWGLLPNMILDVAKENVKMNYAALYYSKDYIVKTDVLIPDEKSILIKLRNIGLSNSNKTKVNLRSINNSVNVLNPNREIQINSTNSLPLLFNFELSNSTIKNGEIVSFELSINQFGFDKKDTIYQTIGYVTPDTLFSSSEIKSYWESVQWGREKDNITGKLILTDSPNSNYKDTTSNYVSFGRNVNLNGFENVTIDFDTRFNIERDFDIATVEISIDSGKTWNYLNSSRMIAGKGLPNSKQKDGMFGFHGHINEWFHQSINLKNYINKSVSFRFGVISDVATRYEGFFIDNIIVKKYKSGYLSSILEPQIEMKSILVSNDNHKLNIINNSLEHFDYIITDLNGNTIKYGDLFNNSINIEDIASGVYNFVIYNQTIIQNNKIAIIR